MMYDQIGVQKGKTCKIIELQDDFRLGLKRIYRIFEYSFEITKRIFVRFETNIRMNLH